MLYHGCIGQYGGYGVIFWSYRWIYLPRLPQDARIRQSPPGWHYITYVQKYYISFRIGNPKLNLHFPFFYGEGRGYEYIQCHVTRDVGNLGTKWGRLSPPWFFPPKEMEDELVVFHQPIWKICSSNWINLPQGSGVKIQENCLKAPPRGSWVIAPQDLHNFCPDCFATSSDNHEQQNTSLPSGGKIHADTSVFS